MRACVRAWRDAAECCQVRLVQQVRVGCGCQVVYVGQVELGAARWGVCGVFGEGVAGAGGSVAKNVH